MINNIKLLSISIGNDLAFIYAEKTKLDHNI